MLKRVIFSAVLLLLNVRPAAAQSTAYLTGTAFADIKRFGSSRAVGIYFYGQDVSLDSTTAGGGLRIGSFLYPTWSLELAIDAEGRSEMKAPNPYAAALAIYPPIPIRIPETKTSTRFLVVSTVVGFHPATHGPVKLAYFAGISFVHSTYKSDYFANIVPLPAEFISASSVAPLPLPPPVIRTTAITEKSNTTGAILGIEAAIDLATHLAVVPEIRALTFSTRGDGVFLIRPGVGVRWNF